MRSLRVKALAGLAALLLVAASTGIGFSFRAGGPTQLPWTKSSLASTLIGRIRSKLRQFMPHPPKVGRRHSGRSSVEPGVQNGRFLKRDKGHRRWVKGTFPAMSLRWFSFFDVRIGPSACLILD